MTVGTETRRAAAAAVAGFLTFVNLYTTQAFLQPMAKDLGVSATQIGFTVTVTLLAVAGFAPIAGAISDRYGRKRIVVGAAIALAIVTLLTAQSGSLVELLVWRTLQGILLPFIFTVTVAYIADECTPQQAAKTSGLYISGTIVGGAGGRLLGGMFTSLGGWRLAFLGLAAVTAVATLFVIFALEREKKFRPMIGGGRGTLRAYGEHLRNPRLLATTFVGFTMLFSMVSSFTFVTFRLSEPPFSLTPARLALIFTVYFLSVLSSPLANRLIAAVGRLTGLLLAIGCAALGLAMTLPDSLPLIMAGLAISTCGLLMVQTLAISFIGAIVPHARSSAVGLYVTLYYIGGAVGSVAPGPIWHDFGWPGVVGMVWIVMAAMAIDVLIFFRVKKAG